MSMRNYLIIHGSFGNPYNNWFPWLHQQLLNKNKLDTYRKARIFNSNTVVIAHSIGCAFITKYLLNRNMIVSKLILVAPFNNYIVDSGDYDYVNKTFYFDNLELVKDYVGEIICIYSDNDPYVKLDACENLRTKQLQKK